MMTNTAPHPPFQALDSAQQIASDLLLDLHQRLLAAPPRLPASSPLGRLRARFAGTQAPVRGLYLWGGVGRGKTYLMDWFVEDLPLAGKYRVHFHHFMRDVHRELQSLRRQRDPLRLVAARLRERMHVLCLDEFLVTDIADAMLLHGLLDALFSLGVTLVTTANTEPCALYRNGLQRARFLPAIALLERHTRVHHLDADTDYRLRALVTEGVYFLTDAGGEQALAERFKKLSGGHEVVDATIHVNGRTLAVRRQGRDVLWCDFATLCGGHYAASDYIEIAREYHTVLLSGVPPLDVKQDSAARRFLHLVDEFYDQRVKLLIAAAVPLTELYRGGLDDFAHERLLSRLIEMQSDDYLAAEPPA